MEANENSIPLNEMVTHISRDTLKNDERMLIEVRELGLSHAANIALSNANIDYIAELIAHGKYELAALAGSDKKTAEHIEAAVKAWNLQLGTGFDQEWVDAETGSVDKGKMRAAIIEAKHGLAGEPDASARDNLVNALYPPVAGKEA